MKKKEAELALQLYTSFLETGDLFVFFPKMSGMWETDKKLFLEQYEKNEEFLKEND